MGRLATLGDLAQTVPRVAKTNPSKGGGFAQVLLAVVDHGVPHCLANRMHDCVEAFQRLEEPRRDGCVNTGAVVLEFFLVTTTIND